MLITKLFDSLNLTRSDYPPGLTAHVTSWPATSLSIISFLSFLLLGIRNIVEGWP
jgi:hypothetical protein